MVHEIPFLLDKNVFLNGDKIILVFDRFCNVRSFARETPEGLPEHFADLPVIFLCLIFYFLYG